MSNEAKHTPGPWYTKVWEEPVIVIMDEKGFLAQTVGGNDEANARLIAAAPDLLHSLKFMVAICKTESTTNIYRAHIKQAQENIDKAEGKTT